MTERETAQGKEVTAVRIDDGDVRDLDLLHARNPVDATDLPDARSRIAMTIRGDIMTTQSVPRDRSALVPRLRPRGRLFLGGAIATAVAAVAMVAVLAGVTVGAPTTALAAVQQAAAATEQAASQSFTWRITSTFASMEDGKLVEEDPYVVERTVVGDDAVLRTPFDPDELVQELAMVAEENAYAAEQWADPTPEETAFASQWIDEIRTIDDRLFIHIDEAHDGPSGWIEYDGVDEPTLVDRFNLEAEPLAIDQIIDLDAIEQVGTETVDGQRMIRYRAPNGLADLRDRTPLLTFVDWYQLGYDGVEGDGTLIEDESNDATSFELWVDDDGLIRRISIGADVSDLAADEFAEVTTLEFSAFGETPSVAVPDGAVRNDDLALFGSNTVDIGAELPDGAPAEQSVSWTVHDTWKRTSGTATERVDGERVTKADNDYAVELPADDEDYVHRLRGEGWSWVDEFKIVGGRLYLHFVDDYEVVQGWVEYASGTDEIEMNLLDDYLVSAPVMTLDQLIDPSEAERVGRADINGEPTTRYRMPDGLLGLTGDITPLRQLSSVVDGAKREGLGGLYGFMEPDETTKPWLEWLEDEDDRRRLATAVASVEGVDVEDVDLSSVDPLELDWHDMFERFVEIDVWVDGDGVIRQLQVEDADPFDDEGHGKSIYTFSDFGETSVEAPTNAQEVGEHALTGASEAPHE